MSATRPMSRAESMLSELRSLARRFLLPTLILVGAMCGVLAVLFEKYVELAREHLSGIAVAQTGALRVVLVIGTPVVVFTLIALAIRRFAPRAVGANLARVRMAYNVDPSLLSRRSIFATFLATPLSLSAGAPLGPEGPIVVITSGVSAAVGRALGLPKKLVRGMIPVGVAAGIAAIFNTPITGVVFALEEVFGAAQRGLLGGVLVGAVAAAVVERALLGGRSLLVAPFSTWTDARELIGFAIVGVVAGLVSGTAIAISHRLKRAWARVMPSMVTRAALAGAIIGACGLVVPSILGVGYDAVSVWLHGGGSADTIGIAFAVKTFAFVIAISSGVLGGSFAPSLFIGTALGATVGHTAHDLFPSAGIDPKAYAIIGMGSFFAGLLRSPIAAVLIVVELTHDYELIVPLMLGVSLAVSISRRISRLSVVEQQMIDEGYDEATEASDPLANLKAGDVMSAAPVTVRSSSTLLDAVRQVAGTRHRIYPVVDDDGRLEGLVRADAFDEAAAGDRMDRRVQEVMEGIEVFAVPSDPVIDVVRRMELGGVDRCPVVHDSSSRKVVGFLTPADIFRGRMRQMKRPHDDSEFDLFR